MPIDLKPGPCPNCHGTNLESGERYVHRIIGKYELAIYRWVMCMECGMRSPIENSECLAIAAWNRLSDLAVELEVTKLRARSAEAIAVLGSSEVPRG